MPFCKNHPEKQLILKGDRMECPDCKYGYDVPKRISVPDLLKENEELKKENQRLLKIINEMVDTQVAIEDVVDHWQQRKTH